MFPLYFQLLFTSVLQTFLNMTIPIYKILNKMLYTTETFLHKFLGTL